MNNVSFDKLENLKKLEVNIETSNQIYIKDNKLYKLYNENYLNRLEKNKKMRLKFIDNIINLNIDGCVFPLGKIYNKDKFVGVYMNYYENYFNLYDLLQMNVDYNTRLNLLKKINETIKNLHKNNIVHEDIHLGNIITNLNSLKIIDFDESNFTYEKYCLKSDIKNMITVIISIIYNFDFEDNIPLEKNKQIKYILKFLDEINIDYNFKEYLKNIYIYNCDTNIIYPDYFFNTFDQEKIEYDNKKLSKR